MKVSKDQIDIATRSIARLITKMCFLDTVKKHGVSIRKLVDSSSEFRSKMFTMFYLMDNDPIAFDLLLNNFMDEVDVEIGLDQEILERVKELKLEFSKKGGK